MDPPLTSHLLAQIHFQVDFRFVRQRLAPFYSATGRPSIDPEALLRLLLVGYLYGIGSERRLLEEVRHNLVYRWFTGFLNRPVPHHSTLSKNRYHRFRQSDLFRLTFAHVVDCCARAGLIDGGALSVDGTLVPASASAQSRVPREQLPEVAPQHRAVRAYLAALSHDSSSGDPPPAPLSRQTILPVSRKTQQDLVSTTDPEATWATKGGPAVLAYFGHYLVDNASTLIVGVHATAARLSQESVAARQMLLASKAAFGRTPNSLGADASYGNGEFLAWLQEQRIAPHVRLKEAPRSKETLYRVDAFTYLPEQNAYRCPAGKQLTYVGIGKHNQQRLYMATPARCRGCPQKQHCTRGRYRKLSIHVHEEARQAVRQLSTTTAFAHSQRARQKVEALFAELKNQRGVARLRLRGLRGADEQFCLAAAAQNLKRLVHLRPAVTEGPQPMAA